MGTSTSSVQLGQHLCIFIPYCFKCRISLQPIFVYFNCDFETVVWIFDDLIRWMCRLGHTSQRPSLPVLRFCVSCGRRSVVSNSIRDKRTDQESNLAHFGRKMWHLVAIMLMLFQIINWPNFVYLLADPGLLPPSFFKFVWTIAFRVPPPHRMDDSDRHVGPFVS